MSIFRTIRQFFSGSSAPTNSVDSPGLESIELEQLCLPNNGWETTTGQLHHPQQERNITFHNSEISGTCMGTIAELTGPVMISLFEDLPTWLPKLLIRVTVQAGEGELIASVSEGNGVVTSVLAPGTLESNAELIAGCVWMRCESGSTPARSVSYEVIII